MSLARALNPRFVISGFRRVLRGIYMRLPFSRGRKAYRGSKGYEEEKEQIWNGIAPARLLYIRDLVPGEIVVELGAAEGVLSLILSEEKKCVFAIDKSKSRHMEGLKLQRVWSEQGRNVSRCVMLRGTLDDFAGVLHVADTLVAMRVIYHLRDQIDPTFQLLPSSLHNVVLAGNRGRARKYTKGIPDPKLGEYNYYASSEGMQEVLVRHGFEIADVRANVDGDPIVVGKRLERP